MNNITKNHIVQNCQRQVRRTWQKAVKFIGVSCVTAGLILLLIPRPGITVAPGGCTSTSGECGTSIDG